MEADHPNLTVLRDLKNRQRQHPYVCTNSLSEKEQQRLASCEGKIPFPSLESAANTRFRGQRINSHIIYHCRYCGCYHLSGGRVSR